MDNLIMEAINNLKEPSGSNDTTIATYMELICTITLASSDMEETRNTLNFTSRAKRIEIYASRNKIIDEKSLIKKYQSEISCLKQELDRLRRRMLVGVDHEELMTLKQKLEEGQVKMQSRLEEEEEAKAALLSLIQKLTKLILLSSKNSTPGYLGDVAAQPRSQSASKDDVSEKWSSREASSWNMQVHLSFL